MCLRFACFGLHKHNDDCYYAPPNRSMAQPPAGAATKPLHHDRPMPAAQRNGHAHYGNGAHHQTAADEARKGPAAAVSRDAPLAYAGAVRQQQAWNGRVAGEAGHAHGAQPQQQQNYYHYYEREPVHREAAMDHRYYTTATATADHERY